MDATDLLKEQHRRVRGLLEQAERTRDPAARRSLLRKIAHAIEVHTKIEAEIFYPAVRRLRTASAEELFLASLEEHDVVHRLVAELILSPDERFRPVLALLQDTVRRHLEQEERQVFALAEQLGTDELARLGERMRARARRLMGHGDAGADAAGLA